jgi:hypothetical protein
VQKTPHRLCLGRRGVTDGGGELQFVCQLTSCARVGSHQPYHRPLTPFAHHPRRSPDDLRFHLFANSSTSFNISRAAMSMALASVPKSEEKILCPPLIRLCGSHFSLGLLRSLGWRGKAPFNPSPRKQGVGAVRYLLLLQEVHAL